MPCEGLPDGELCSPVECAVIFFMEKCRCALNGKVHNSKMYGDTDITVNYLVRALVFCSGNEGLGRSSLITEKQNRNKQAVLRTDMSQWAGDSFLIWKTNIIALGKNVK